MRPTETEFRLGLIGAGAVGIRHVEAARDTAGVSLRAVCDLSKQTATEAADPTGADVYTDYREMLTGTELDGIIITSPHSLHAEMAIAAAAAGTHVLVEKPMATSVEDCDRMIDACERAGVVLAVGHVSRFDASIAEASRVITGGDLGPVQGITHRRSSHYELGSRPGWFFDPVLAGGGIVINVGTHGLDRIQWLGEGTATRITAQALHRDDLPVETDCFGIVELDSGVKASFVLTSTGGPYFDETVVLCQNGSLRWSATEGLWVSHGGRPEKRVGTPTASPQGAFAAQLNDFVTACRGGMPPRIGGRYGRAVVATVLAAYRSSATGQPALVPAPRIEQPV